jgi:hypothetical protein
MIFPPYFSQFKRTALISKHLRAEFNEIPVRLPRRGAVFLKSAPAQAPILSFRRGNP